VTSWQGNVQIKVGSKHPQSSHGPALAVLNDTLYMVYVGSGGKNLWYSYLPARGGFNDWQGNEQIKISSRSIPLSSYRPALAVLNQTLHMVYVGEGGHNLWWAWFDGKSWGGNIKLPYSTMAPQPALAAFNNELHLVIHEYVPAAIENLNGQPIVTEPPHDYLFYAKGTLPSSPASWGPAVQLGDGAFNPSLSVFNNQLYLVMSQSSAKRLLYAQSAAPGVWSGWSAFSHQNFDPKSSGGVATAPFGGNLSVVYPGEGGHNIWYSSLSITNVTSGNVQVKTTLGTPETSAPIGTAVFENTLCVAYKGKASDNLWFSYLPA
jgi:hypothetical protein